MTAQSDFDEFEALQRRIEEMETRLAERARAEETLRRQNQYLEALHETALELTHRLEPAELLENMLKRVAQFLGTAHGYIYLVEPGQAEIEVHIGLGLYARLVGHRLKLGEGLAGRVWQTGQSLAVQDYAAWPDRTVRFSGQDIHATVGMPLKSGDQVIGVIGVSFSDPNRSFDEAELEVLHRFAQLGSIIFGNAQLFSNAQQRAERMSALNAIGQTLTSTLSLDRLYPVICQQASRVLKVDAFYIALYDESRQAIHFPFHYDEGEYREPDTSPMGNGPTSYVIRTRAPYVVHHPGDAIQEGAIFFGNVERPSASAMHVPMLAGDRMIGVISVQSYEENAYDSEDLQMLQVIANQAAISIENARLYDSGQRELNERKQAEAQLEQRNRELTFINRASQAFSSTFNVDQILVTLIDEVCTMLNVASSSVWLVDPATNELICRHIVGIQRDIVRNWRLTYSNGLTGWVVAHDESLIVPDVQVDPRHRGKGYSDSEPTVHSLLCVPLRARDKVIGTLNVVDTTIDRFQATDRTLLESLAASAAIALDNARLVETLRQHTLELESRNEELDAFAHTVAHDLNNPLANIVGHVETLALYQDEMSDAERQASLQSISYCARKMSNIINELLLLSGVRKTEAEVEPLYMASILDEAQERLDSLIKEYRAEIVRPDASTWPVALGYAPWVEEVWINYLSNAIKYGGQPPRIEVGGAPQANGMMRFWVRDNGDGLTPEALDCLFTPFTRLARIRANGHGLGLSIARRIVEKLGGQVGVESQGLPGQGSLFFFTLPGAKGLE